MKKIAIGLLGLSLALTLGGCGQKKTELPEPTPEAKGEAREELTVYTFEDSGVKFTLEVPKTWERIELLGYEGDEEREGSPTVGVRYPFDTEENQMFAVMASLYSPFSVDETLFETTPYQTASSLTGVRYIREIDGERMEYYIFGDEDTELPQLFAVVTMSRETYAAHEAEIEAAVKSLKFG